MEAHYLHEPRIHRAVYRATGTQPNEPLPAYAWPGGYPFYYLDHDNCVVCAACATRVEEFSSCIVAAGIEEEPPDDGLQCEQCQAWIVEPE